MMSYKKFFNPVIANKVGEIYNCKTTANMLESAIKTVNKIDAWPYITKHGLKFNNSTIVDEYILREIDNNSNGHSGLSMACVCIHINKIASCGLNDDEYIKLIKHEYTNK